MADCACTTGSHFFCSLPFIPAAEQAHPFALLELGHSLFSGRGTKKDVEKAFAFYKQAANANVSEAENSVGIMLEEGVGTIQDIDQAVYWYTRAASRVSGAHRRTRLSQTPAVAAV